MFSVGSLYCGKFGAVELGCKVLWSEMTSVTWQCVAMVGQYPYPHPHPNPYVLLSTTS